MRDYPRNRTLASAACLLVWAAFSSVFSGCLRSSFTFSASPATSSSLLGSSGSGDAKLAAVHVVLKKHCYSCHGNYSGIGVDTALTTSLVVPGRPTESKLFAAIVGSGVTGSAVTSFAQLMPWGRTASAAPSPSELESIRSWIAGLQPAPSNPTPAPTSPSPPAAACSGAPAAGLPVISGTQVRTGWEIWGFSGSQPTSSSITPACSHGLTLKYTASANYDGWVLSSGAASAAAISGVTWVSMDMYVSEATTISIAATWPGAAGPHQYLVNSNGSIAYKYPRGWTHRVFDLSVPPSTPATGMVVPAPYPRTINAVFLEVQSIDPDGAGTRSVDISIDNLVFTQLGASPLPSPSPSSTATVTTFAQVYANKCASCHSLSGPAANLDRSANELRDAGLIVPRDPASSRLFYKLIGSATGRTPSEENMPRAPVASLTSAELQAVRDFINSATVVASDCTAPANTPTRVVRLTGPEIDASLSDLFGASITVSPTLGVDQKIGGFSNNADILTVPEAFLSALSNAVDTVLGSRLDALVANASYSCSTPSNDAPCLTRFLSGFGKKAFRRPLTAAEVSDLTTVYASGKANGDGTYKAGIKAVVQAMLLSSDFLFRTELGSSTPSTTQNTVVTLTPYETAALISYSINGSPPDDALMAAADAAQAATAQVMTPATIVGQVDRLLAENRAGRATARFETFVQHWLGTDEILGVSRDTSQAPGFTPSMRLKLVSEVERIAADAFDSSGSTLGQLLAGGKTFMDSELASFYGVGGIPADGQFRPVALSSATHRSGILTSGAVLATYANTTTSSPTKRGKMLREQVLCQFVPPPPPQVNVSVPAVTPGSSTRQRMERHVTDSTCSACHNNMDGLGFGLENFDSVGLFRETDNSISVENTWIAYNLDQTTRQGAGPIALINALVGSDEAKRCFVQKWLTFQERRPISASTDACQVSKFAADFDSGGARIRALVRSNLVSDLFNQRVVK